MAAHATKRRKVNYPARSENEDGRGASDNGSASSTDDGGAVVEENNTSGIRHNAREGAKTRLDEVGQFASGAYNSNMFKLQMDELLVKVRPKSEKRMSKVENALRKLKSIIESIPSQEALPVGYQIGSQ
jgi:U3 small nucleolar RNA-associated protein 22